MEHPQENNSLELRTHFQNEREGVKVEGYGSAAHFHEQLEGGGRAGQEGVGSDEGVEAEGRWVLDGFEYGRDAGDQPTTGALGSGMSACGNESGEGVEDVGEDGGGVMGKEGVGDGLGVQLVQVADALASFQLCDE